MDDAVPASVTPAPRSGRSPPRTPPRAARTAAISFGTMPPSNRPRRAPPPPRRPAARWSARRRRGRRGRPDEEDALRAESDRERGRGLVGVDVERACGERRDDRDTSPAASASTTAAAREGLGSPTRPSPSTGVPRARSRRRRDRRRRADRRADVGVDGRERLADDLEHLGCRHAAAVDERRLDPATLHLGRDLRSCAVDDDVRRRRALRARRGPTSAATRPPSFRTTGRSRRVLRVEPDVVVREVGREVRSLAVAETEVELDPCRPARRARGRDPSAPRSRRPAVPSNETESRSGSRCAKPPFHGAEPGRGEDAAPVRVVPEGCGLDERRGRDAERDRLRLVRRRSARGRRSRERRSRPRRRRRSAVRGRRRRPRRRAANAASCDAVARITALRCASRTTASFVEQSPSTEIRLNDRSTAGRRNAVRLARGASG